MFGIIATIYTPDLLRRPTAKDTGAFEVSQLVWAIFLVLNVALTFASRELMREVLERRWRAGIGLKRILIAGSGELGRLIADKILEHRELGYQIVGFVDDRAAGDHLGYRGLPLLGTLDDAAEITARESVDHLYVALPPEQHMRMLELLESTSREMVDVKVVPDLLQVIALRARLEDLDGVPVINVNDVPLQGFNSVVKRGIDIGISDRRAGGVRDSARDHRRCSSSSPRAARCSTARSAWASTASRSRSSSSARCTTMPSGRPGRSGRSRATRASPRSDASCGARTSTSCRSSGTCCAATCRSSARGRSGRTSSQQFKHKIPQYMLRHKVKAGLTGWAQVNGWRGNTPLEKRIEYDLYYIENWSVRLDLKIMWLTLIKGFFHKHAY